MYGTEGEGTRSLSVPEGEGTRLVSVQRVRGRGH